MSGPSNSNISPTSSNTGTNTNQTIRCSLQNFPIPVQLQARIPRSPLSVAQELLPNFPSHLNRQQEQLQQLFPATIQQHLQQQLQMQFQRQLQLNLQGRGESSRAPEIPDPPDTLLDIDLPGGGNSSYGHPTLPSGTTSGTTQGIRGGFNAHLLEALFRNTQVASLQQRMNSNNNSGSASHRFPSGSSHQHSHNNYMSDENSSDTLIAHNVVGFNGAAAGGVTGSGDGVPNTGLQQTTELTMLTKWVAESGIFILLLFLHFVYDHSLGLLVFLCLGGTFYYTNMKLVHAIHQSAVREQNRSWLGLLNLMWLCGFLLLNIAIIFYVFSEQEMWRLLYFRMAIVADISVWTLLWCVVLTDYIIKFLTVITKSILAMFQPCCKNYRRRGKYYLLIESISQLYRQVVTIVPWWYYLNDNTRTGVWFAFITEAVYLGFKSWSVWGSVQFLYTSYQRFQSSTSFGVKPSSSEMVEKGNQCPICQDTINDPIMLPCKHIFCEQCVSIWFDREKTCPMCRAEITTEFPVWKDGNTSPHLQWH